ncbi:hypothetical protein C2E23DRAFT_837875 [Lenzites betulinus]|nr:hypothetical protein C2E23DRAFT_837875 [Lenzites betulinus]
MTLTAAPSGSPNTTRLQSPFPANSTLPYFPLHHIRPLPHMSPVFDPTSAYDHHASLALPRTPHTSQAPPAQNTELSQEMSRFSSSLTDHIPLPAVQSSVAHGGFHIPHPPAINTGFDTFCMPTPIWTSAVQIEPHAQLYESDIVSCRVDVPSTPQVDPFASLRTLPDDAYINGIQHDAPGFGQNTASHSALGLNIGAPSSISTFAVDHTTAGPPSALRLDLGSCSDGWTSSGDELPAGWFWEPAVHETSVYDHSYIDSDLSIPAFPSSPPAVMGSCIEPSQGAPTGYTPPVTPVLQPVLDGLSLDEGDDPWFLSGEQANGVREDESTSIVYGLQTSLTDP